MVFVEFWKQTLQTQTIACIYDNIQYVKLWFQSMAYLDDKTELAKLWFHQLWTLENHDFINSTFDGAFKILYLVSIWLNSNFETKVCTSANSGFILT